MPQTRHTLGPWVQGRNHPAEVFEDKTGQRIANCCDNTRSYQEQEANAALIAAAPSMLAVCEDMMRYLEAGPIKTQDDIAHCLDKLNKAINQATGRDK